MSLGRDLLTQCDATFYLLRVILFFRRDRLLVLVQYTHKFIYTYTRTYNVRVYTTPSQPTRSRE